MPISALQFRQPPTRKISITDLYQTQVNHPNAHSIIEFTIFENETIPNCKVSLHLPRASKEAESVKNFLFELNLNARNHGLHQSNQTRLKEFLINLLKTGQPQEAWDGAIVLYKNACLPNQISPDMLADENWIHCIVRLTAEPQSPAQTAISLEQRIQDLLSSVDLHKKALSAKENNLEEKNQLLSPLNLATASDNLDVFKAFLSNGLNDGYKPNAIEKGRLNLLHLATLNGANRIIEYLLTHEFCIETHKPKPELNIHNDPHLYVKMPVDQKGEHKETPLMLAARNGHLATVKLLLQKSANLYARRADHQSAYMIAFKHNQEKVFNFLYNAIEDQKKLMQTDAEVFFAEIHQRNLLPKGVTKLSEGDIKKTFKSALEKNHAFAQLWVAVDILKKHRTSETNPLINEIYYAKHLLELAAQQGEPLAYNHLGMMYLGGSITTNNLPNIAKAYEYFTIAANENCAESHHNLGDMHYQGRIPNSAKNFEKAYEHYVFASKYGLSCALARIGEMFMLGIVPGLTKPDYTKAHQLLLQAAKKGDDIAQNRLGELHFAGLAPENIGPNHVEAYRLFQLAANQENIASIARLGQMHLLALVPNQIGPNYPMAFQYLNQAARANQANAQYYLGIMFINGLIPGQPAPNFQEAFNLFSLASNQNQLGAITSLGRMYLLGLVPEQPNPNYEQAFNLLNIAAMQNHPQALRLLGQMYLNNYVPGQAESNHNLAVTLLGQAANAGDLEARNLLLQIHNNETILNP